jgi:DNA-binding XRE family transcriptional regulator
MKVKRAAYQRVLLDGRWYVILAEEEFRALAETRKPGQGNDVLDAMSLSDQRLADRLLQRRREAGLTQKELAQRAGVRVETLNRIEKGRTSPDFGTIRKLVNAMKTQKDNR